LQADTVAANPGPDWRITGTGDFYGDGHADILWQNDDGEVAIWKMNGTAILQSGTVANPGPAWHVAGTGDFNNDGKTDIVWQHEDGPVAVWEMNGTAISSSAVVANPGPTWSVAGDDSMRFIHSGAAGETLAATTPAADEFVFTAAAAGDHTITGFSTTQDLIQLDGAQFAGFAAVQAATTATADGAMIDLGHGGSLLLSGVDPAALTARNFAVT
jgi:hypothetical protein